MDFSKRLKKLRLEKDMSQEELAKLLEVSRTSITNYELGRNEASTQVLNKLSEIFNCSIDYLLGKSDVRNPKQENDINEELLKVGFDMKNYNPPTDKQKEQIKALLEVILKDNKKDEEN